MEEHPVWAEVDLAAIAHNVREIRRVTSTSAQVLVIVKANGYGHGAVEVSKAALANGADWLGVARISEARALREAGIDAPILVLGYVPPEQAPAVIQLQLSPTVYSPEMVAALSAAAAKENTKAKIHIKIDTGMGRIGFWWDANPIDAILKLAQSPHLELEGIFTHFANAEADFAYTNLQLERFLGITEELRRQGLEIPLRHAANSPALMTMPITHLDMVRAGIIVYGLYPTVVADQWGIRLRPALDRKAMEMAERWGVHLQPAMEWKARVAYVKRVPAGFKVSYGCTHTTDIPTTIVTLPLGYADGYPRSMSSKGEVLIQGQPMPIIGRVCMDQMMVDAGDAADIAMGDEVVLLGRQGNTAITAEDLAMKLDTINYEVVCMISSRVPRKYIRGAGPGSLAQENPS